MVKRALAFVLALSGAFALHARDISTYRVGDAAEVDITTPMALDVIDPVSTALLKESEKLKTPAVFRDFTAAVTNAAANELQAAFAGTRSNFMAAVEAAFQKPALDEAGISSPEFASLIAKFNAVGQNLPVAPELAARWARGETGLATQNRWLGALLSVLHAPVCADSLSGDLVIGETLRLVPVNTPDEKPALDAVPQGRLVTVSSLVGLARARELFRAEFPENEQALAGALANWLQPNCAPDAAVTQQARDRDVHVFAVVDHFEAGQIVVHRGAKIDVKDKAALDQLHEKLIPVELNFKLEVEREQAQQQSQSNQAAALKLQSQAAKDHARNVWLAVALAVVSVVALAAFWRLASLRVRVRSLALARTGDLQLPAVQADIAVHLAQAVKEALLQELAAQRGELLKAQQSAANELVELVRRLDELQIPLQERLRAYETRIQNLEKMQWQVAQPELLPAAATTAPETNGNATLAADEVGGVNPLLTEGQALLDANQPEEALKYFDAALAAHPDHAEALIKKGGALERLGQFDAAIACYDRAIASDNSMTIAYLHKGGLFNRMARYDEAMACYEKALQSQGKVTA